MVSVINERESMLNLMTANKIEVEGAHVMSEMLKVNTTLTKVNLRRNIGNLVELLIE